MSFDRKSTPSIAHQNASTTKTDLQLPGERGEPNLRVTRLEKWAADFPERYAMPICGGIAGAVSGMVSCPLDVIKTKLQAQGGYEGSSVENSGIGTKLSTKVYRGVQGSAAIIWKEEGLRGLYRGLGPMLLGYVPTWAVYLTVYNEAQAYFRTKTDNWFLANIYASLSGGACSTMATNPIWVIKTRLMSQTSSRSTKSHSRSPWQYRSTLDAAKKMYQTEGLLSFYSGLTPALLGLTHVAIQFPLYEVFKQKFTGLGAGRKESEEDHAHHYYGLAFAVFLSKVCASTATYPHEVVRTRLQTQRRSAAGHSSNDVHFRNGSDGMTSRLRYRGTWQTCKTILAEEGWRGFYAGLGANLIRAVPSAMTTILTFEFLKSTFYDLRYRGLRDLE